ncbi:PREDICTED: cyclin-dependent kinase inhibitor 4-like [Tarenaya hassleriana]|uniref:cyclin-dependent kinase inhibitor 4-like n=1 Tax=Tarenaya hassleriana TaxID=28532 RepID=UPI0008FD50F0|nr:PREDICTED: cyclin-dependent kinase inhibitor 4-like [Tarenaya hassleriana]
MGRYLRKSKTADEAVALMDVSHSSLAAAAAAACGREKLPIVVIRPAKRRKQRERATCVESPNPNSQKLDSPSGSLRGSGGDGSRSGSVAESVVCAKEKEILVGEKDANKDLRVETSSGENFSGLEGRERTRRESTPCSLIRDSETVKIPGSSMRLTRGVMETSSPREESLSGHILPSTHEMDEFFSGAEEEQQRRFIEKYNFDPVNEKPLPGRYEWKKARCRKPKPLTDNGGTNGNGGGWGYCLLVFLWVLVLLVKSSKWK